MTRPPRDPSEDILSKSNQATILWQALILSLGSLAAFFIAFYALYPGSPDKARTVVFTTLVLAELLHSFNVRSERLTLMELSFIDNKALLAALGASLSLHLAVIFVPVFMRLFGTAYLDMAGWGLIIACSILPVILIDRVKLVLRRKEG